MTAGMGVSTLNQAPPMISTRRCEAVTDFSRLEQFSSDWDRLWRADPKAEIFQSFSWARAWWRSYGHKVTLYTLVVFEAAEVIGILPLIKHGDVVGFLGNTQTDYCDILCEDGRAVDVLAAGIQRLLASTDWKRCVLRHLKLESRIVSHWVSLSPDLRSSLQIVPARESHTILLDRDRDVLFPLLTKHHTRRRLNKLRKSGSLTFRHIESKSEAQIQLDHFLKHQIRRRTLAGKSSAAAVPEFQQFLRALVNELDLQKELRFGVLELDSQPLAWHISFHVNGKLVLYQQAFDVDAWDYTPGEVLIHHLLVYVRQNVSREFDLTHGNEPFKDRFTTHTGKTFSIYLDRHCVAGKIRRICRLALHPLTRLANALQQSAKRHDKTVRAFRLIRLWVLGALNRGRYYQHKGLLLDWGRQTALRLFRHSPLSKECLRVFVLADNAATANVHCASSQLSVTEGRCGDLVDLARENPQIIVPFELPQYRRRIKRGAKLYLVRQASEIIVAAWVATGWPEEALPLEDCDRDFARDLMLIYDLWIVGDAVGTFAYRELLRELTIAAKENRMSLGLCTDVESGYLYAEIVRKGFHEAYRLDRSGSERRFRLTPLGANPG